MIPMIWIGILLVVFVFLVALFFGCARETSKLWIIAIIHWPPIVLILMDVTSYLVCMSGGLKVKV